MPETLVDARNLACPQPVVLARKALLEPDAQRVRVLLSSRVSVENVRRMAKSQGWEASTEEHQGGEFEMVLSRTGAPAAAHQPAAAASPPSATPNVVVFIASDLFGTGDEPLGRVLMRAFIKTLGDLDPAPAALIFANAGVRLTTEGSDLLEDLAALAEAGMNVVSCGTCLDYYGLVDSLRVGVASNMYEIASLLVAADRVVRP